MALPPINPIDAGWLPRSIPIDHLGTTTISCPVCDTNTKAETFRVIVGRHIGFGSPFFVAPFLKRRSTAGKLGTRAVFNQCCSCTSMFAGDEDARNWLFSNGLSDGVMSDAAALKMANNRLGAAERDQKIADAAAAPPMRARKFDG